MTERPRVRIHYRRPPDREQIFDQIVVLERDDVIVTLSETMEFDPPMRIESDIVLETGSSVVWFTYPGAWHDVGRFHLADGTFTGFYANVLTPPEIDGRVWHTTDLYLDVFSTRTNSRKPSLAVCWTKTQRVGRARRRTGYWLRLETARGRPSWYGSGRWSVRVLAPRRRPGTRHTAEPRRHELA